MTVLIDILDYLLVVLSTKRPILTKQYGRPQCIILCVNVHVLYCFVLFFQWQCCYRD